MWDVPLPDIIETRKQIIVSDVFAIIIVGFTKLSVLALYLRLSPSARFRRTVYAIMAITVLWGVVMTALAFVLCIPLHAYWNVRYTGPQTCLEEVPFYLSFSGGDVGLDAIIYILPLPIVLRLKMPARQKLMLMGVFGLGLL
jgi:hypothetical protein